MKSYAALKICRRVRCEFIYTCTYKSI